VNAFLAAAVNETSDEDDAKEAEKRAKIHAEAKRMKVARLEEEEARRKKEEEALAEVLVAPLYSLYNVHVCTMYCDFSCVLMPYRPNTLKARLDRDEITQNNESYEVVKGGYIDGQRCEKGTLVKKKSKEAEEHSIDAEAYHRKKAELEVEALQVAKRRATRYLGADGDGKNGKKAIDPPYDASEINRWAKRLAYIKEKTLSDSGKVKAKLDADRSPESASERVGRMTVPEEVQWAVEEGSKGYEEREAARIAARRKEDIREGERLEKQKNAKETAKLNAASKSSVSNTEGLTAQETVQAALRKAARQEEDNTVTMGGIRGGGMDASSPRSTTKSPNGSPRSPTSPMSSVSPRGRAESRLYELEYKKLGIDVGQPGYERYYKAAVEYVDAAAANARRP